MRRLPMSLVVAAALAACSEAPPPTALPQQGVTASFPPGGIANLIHVDALDTRPLRNAELVAPDGTATPASYLNVDKTPQAANGENTLDDPWRTSMLGTNGLPQLPSAPLSATYRSRDTLLLMVSRAEIALSDPVAYRRDWQKYRIRVSFAGAGSAPDTQEIAAPQPPPG
jgi:hypothetical protein